MPRGVIFETHFSKLLCSCRPSEFGRLSKYVEDAVELVEIVCAWEEGVSEVELNNDTGEREDINKATILFGSKQVFRSSVPTRGDIVSGYLLQRHRQSKINQLNFSLSLIDKNILWFDIAVDDTSLVDVG